MHNTRGIHHARHTAHAHHHTINLQKRGQGAEALASDKIISSGITVQSCAE